MARHPALSRLEPRVPHECVPPTLWQEPGLSNVPQYMRGYCLNLCPSNQHLHSTVVRGSGPLAPTLNSFFSCVEALLPEISTQPSS